MRPCVDYLGRGGEFNLYNYSSIFTITICTIQN